MTTPLDEKGLEAARASFVMENSLERAIRAYLSATPAPDGLEVVAWDKLRELIGEYFDLGYAEGVVQRDADTMAGDAQRTLSEVETIISQAQSALAAMREANKALMDERTNLVATKREQIASLTAQVKRLTEDNEALRDGVEHVETLSELLKIIKEHWIDYDHVFSIAVDEADKFVAACATLNSRETGE